MIKFILEECIMVCGWCVLGRMKKWENERKIFYESGGKKQVKPSQKTGTWENRKGKSGRRKIRLMY